MGIDTRCGVMESEMKLREMIDIFAREIKAGKKIGVDVVYDAKDHKGETMLCLFVKEKDNVNIWHIELSCIGTFCYEFDDSVS